MSSVKKYASEVGVLFYGCMLHPSGPIYKTCIGIHAPPVEDFNFIPLSEWMWHLKGGYAHSNMHMFHF